MSAMNHRHALKFSLLGIVQQQRILARLEQNYKKKPLQNAEDTRADTMRWHRRVRLSREARAINLYRAFLKGLPYLRVETNIRAESLDPVSVFRDYYNQTLLPKAEWEAFVKWVG